MRLLVVSCDISAMTLPEPVDALLCYMKCGRMPRTEHVTIQEPKHYLLDADSK
jgi:hypothetical protein